MAAREAFVYFNEDSNGDIGITWRKADTKVTTHVGYISLWDEYVFDPNGRQLTSRVLWSIWKRMKKLNSEIEVTPGKVTALMSGDSAVSPEGRVYGRVEPGEKRHFLFPNKQEMSCGEVEGLLELLNTLDGYGQSTRVSVNLIGRDLYFEGTYLGHVSVLDTCVVRLEKGEYDVRLMAAINRVVRDVSKQEYLKNARKVGRVAKKDKSRS